LALNPSRRHNIAISFLSLRNVARSSLAKLTLRPQLVLVLAGVLLVLAILAISATRSYTSDDVAQQNAVAIFSLRTPPILNLPQDTYVLKLPLYALLQVLPLPPATRLLVAALILNLAGFALFYWAARSFIRTHPQTHVGHLMPLLWLVGLGASLAAVLINPNTRNIEIGLAFGALAVAARWYKGEWQAAGRRGITLSVIFVTLLGLLFFDDPYFGYMLAVPIILFFGSRWLFFGRDRQALLLAMAMLAALAIAQVWYWIFWFLGIHAGQGSASFTTLPGLGHNAQLFLQGVLDLFNANIFGRPVLSFQSLALELNFLFLATTLLAPLLLLAPKVRQDVWKVFLVLQPPYLALAFIAGSMAVDTGSGRYLVLLPFYTVLLLIVVVVPLLTVRARNVLAGALLLATIFNVASTASIYLNRGDDPNGENQEIARTAKARDLMKGYASYWNAGINQYYADNKILFIQSGCSRTTGVKPYRLLLNEQVLHRQASTSFYLFDPATTRCTEADFGRYFGEPQGVVELTGRKRLLLYDYDITTRMSVN
jgi:hypothetical protein